MRLRRGTSGKWLVVGGGGAASLAAVLAVGNSAAGERIEDLGAPVDPDDAARLADIPAPSPPQDLASVLSEGSSAGGARITSLGAPVDPNDAARLADIPAPAPSAYRVAETFAPALGGVSYENNSLGQPIYLPAGFVVRSFFTHFVSVDTSPDWQMALYDIDGVEVARMPVTPVAAGAQQVAADAEYTVLLSGLYILVLGCSGGGTNLHLITTQPAAAVIGCANLGGDPLPLPASVSPTSLPLHYWCGVSEDPS